MKHKKVWAAISAGLALLTGGIFATRAFAYTVNNDLSAYGKIVQQYGSYTLLGGDSVTVGYTGPYTALYGRIIHIAQEQAYVGNMGAVPDGQGNWGIMQANMVGTNANNGYLLVAAPSESPNVSQWVTRLGGNLSYVQNYLQSNNQLISTKDDANYSSYTYVPFSSIVNASGAKYGTKTSVATGQSYQGHPVYVYTYPVYTSNPPQATGLSITDGNVGGSTITQGDPLNITAKSTVWLWSGLANFHYDAVEITNNSTGQSHWIVGANNTGRSAMDAVSGGHGYYSDNLTSSVSSSNLQPGSYTAQFWVLDGVDRLSATAATTTFTITPASGGGGGGPTVSLSANPISLPTGQSSTLTATASNVPSDDYLEIEDMSGAGTLSGSNSAYSATTGATSLQATAVSNTAQSVQYQAVLVSTATGQYDAVSTQTTVTWGTATPPTAPTITFNPTTPTTVTSGTPVSLSYTTSGWQPGDSVLIIPNGSNTRDTWSNNNDTNSADYYSETENPQNGAASQVQYTAYLFNSSGNIVATAQSGQITWTSTAPPPPGTIHVSPAPETVQSGQPVTIQYTTTNWAAGDYVTVTPSGSGTNEWSNSHDTNANDQFTEIENPVNGNSTTVTYTLRLYNGAGVEQSQASTQITWGSVKPSIAFTASPTSLTSAGTSNLYYSVSNLAHGDYVDVVGTGSGQHAWNASNLTSASGSYAETETPENGATVTEAYTATVYNSSGQALSQATGSVTWTSVKPTISMLANPTKMVPGQPSTISYSVQNLQTGDYVNVVGTGGTDAWNVSNQSSANEQYTETENPAAGQTTTVNYTATVYSGTGQALNSATVSAAWVNAWTGTVNLSGSPLYLPTGNPTTLTATGSASIPSGYSMYIKDNSTGQIVSQSSNTPESASYTSYNSETDQFQAYVWDGYEQVGNPSNTVSVVWSSLSLSANPTMLSVNNGSTLTVTGQNVPSGDYLIIYDQTTGQVVGYSQGTPYSVTQTQSTAQTDTYQAYINSSATPTGAYATSNPVTVDWYSVTLTAVPTRLPVNQTSTLTAVAQNIPSGYVVDILDKTTNTVIASGQPGQTTIQALQTKSQVETDQYIAQVVQPSNPPIPGLSVASGAGSASIVEQSTIWAGTNGNGVAYWNGSSWINVGNPNGNGSITQNGLAYDPVTSEVWAGTKGSGAAYWNGSSWVNSGDPAGGTTVNGFAFDSSSRTMWAATNAGVAYWNGSSWVAVAAGPSTNVISITYDSQDNVIWASFSNVVAYWNGSSWVNANTSHYAGSIYYDPAFNRIYAGSYSGGGLGYETGLSLSWTTDSNAGADWGIESITGTSGTIYNTAFINYNLYSWANGSSSTSTATSFGSQGQSVTVDSRGNIWIGTQSSGVVEYTPNGSTNVVSATVNGTGHIEAVINADNLRYVGNYAGFIPDVPQDTYGNAFTEDTPYNVWQYPTAGDFGEHRYFAPNGQTIAFVSATLTTNMYGYNAGTYYSNPYIKAFNSAGQQIGIDNIQTTYNAPDTQTVTWTPPAGTTELAFGWIYNSGYNGAGNWTAEWSNVQVNFGSSNFPYWTFQQMPSYVPTSLFTQQATPDAHYSGGYIWVDNGTSSPNGTAFFESTFNLPQSESVTFNLSVDDYAQVYVDGQAIMQQGSSGGVGASIPNTTSTTVTIPAGNHQVIVEAMNNNAFTSSSPNWAGLGLTVSSGGSTLLATANASQWMTTGYVTQLPAGWFSGAIGTYNFTEYILQENQANPIYQRQSYTVQTVAQNVDAQSPPLAVSWYNPILAPDNFNLQALPSNVTYPAQTQFKVTFDQSDINFVNQEFAGTAKVVVRAVQTWQPVATGTWTPNTQGTSTALPYTPVGGTSLQYVAFLVDPNKNVPVAVSNQVTVTDTGHGITGNSYTTTSCSAQGNGTEIFNTYTNGKLTSTRTVPLTMQNLEVDGIFNATQQLHNDLGTVIHLPVTNAQIGNGPIPLRVQAPFAFAIQFPNAQPTTVTATFHVIENDPVNMNGDTSWTVKMHPVTNLPYGFWQGETIMPKLPDGDHISVQITATDDCGSVSTPTGVAPYDNFVTTNGRPQWYFIQPSSP